ncbi:hypothetical protein EON65_27455 [archaeon]|nr:MAG: hypothetical protein EON65_27455 [archaeon]
MIIGNKRVPFADLPVTLGQNSLPSTPSRDLKQPKSLHSAKVVIQSDGRHATTQPKSIPFALHMALMTSQRKALETLYLENCFLKWKMKSQNHKTAHPNTHPPASSSTTSSKHIATLNSSDQAEMPKWATPKKRKLESAETTAGIENLHNAYKTMSTPAKTPTSKLPNAKTPSAKTPSFKDSSTPVSDRHNISAPSKQESAEDTSSPFQSKGNLLARLALLEEEIQHVKLCGNSNGKASANTSGSTKSKKGESKGSVFEQDRSDPTAAAEEDGADGWTDKPHLAPQSFSVHKTSEGKPRDSEPSAVDVGDKGFHYWMLKKMYTQHTNLDSKVWGQINSGEQFGQAASGAKNAFVRNISVSMAPLGEQYRSKSEALVPLCSLPLVQSKMSDWKNKYHK